MLDTHLARDQPLSGQLSMLAEGKVSDSINVPVKQI